MTEGPRQQPGVDWMPLPELLADHPPARNSGAETWEEAAADILARVCLCCGQQGHYQLQLEAHLREHGLDQGVCIGDDGRLLDGHHRVVAARRLGIQRIPLEDATAAADRWVSDHGPVPWALREKGDVPPGGHYKYVKNCQEAGRVL